MRAGVIALIVAAVIALIWYIGQRERDAAWELGGLSTVRDSEHGFRVVKILAIDPGVVSIRMYKQSFEKRPSGIDPSALTLGPIDDADGFGVGHLPLDVPTFSSWAPQFVLRSTVTDEELEGDRMWQESGGGVFE
jgi:hypothetical protein